MKKMLTILAVAAVSLAATGPCHGPINSASAARACTTASQVGATVDVIAAGLRASGLFSPDKIDAAARLIAIGKLFVDANCAILVPPTPPAPAQP